MALQGRAGCLILCKHLAAMEVQLEVLPAVLCCMRNGIAFTSPGLQADNGQHLRLEIMLVTMFRSTQASHTFVDCIECA